MEEYPNSFKVNINRLSISYISLTIISVLSFLSFFPSPCILLPKSTENGFALPIIKDKVNKIVVSYDVNEKNFLEEALDMFWATQSQDSRFKASFSDGVLTLTYGTVMREGEIASGDR